MEYFEIAGSASLSGSVSLCGAKNSVLPLLAASLLTDGRTLFSNVPDLTDVKLACGMLSVLGVRYRHAGDIIEVEDGAPRNETIPKELMTGMRGSFIFLAPLLARLKKVTMALPGGCNLGKRPVDIHTDALRKMGARIDIDQEGRVFASLPDGHFSGADIILRFPSVGATENILMAAAMARGITTVSGAAREPEILDLCNYLNACGAEITGAGSGLIVIHGVEKLTGARYAVMPDRILAATLITAAVTTRSRIEILRAHYQDLKSVLRAFGRCGVQFDLRGDRLAVDGSGEIRPIGSIRCEPHPGFPTDAGPLLVAALCRATGRSEIYDTVFEQRFSFAQELNKFGADAVDQGRIVTVNKVCRGFEGANVQAEDLRGGAALVCMALGAQGRSAVSGLAHIDRGYDALEKTFAALGADIRRIVV